MSITFSIPNKRGFLGFQKVLKISELLGFVDGLELHPIQKEFVYLGLDKLALLRCWVPAKSGRYIDLEYDKTQQTYNVRILTPSTLADWSQALTLILSYQVVWGQASVMNMVENITVQVSGTTLIKRT